MKAYILSIAGAILLSSVLTALLPPNKMGKFLKGMAQLFVFTVVAAPMITRFEGGFDFISAPIARDESYIAKCAELLSKERAEEVSLYLAEKFGCDPSALEVCVEVGEDADFPNLKITIHFLGIFGQDEHIDMAEQIEAALGERYGCQAEVV